MSCPRAQDERGRALVDLAVVGVVGQLVEIEIALFATWCFGRHGDDARDALGRTVRLEAELGLGVGDQALAIGERKLLVELAGVVHLLDRVGERIADEDGRLTITQVAARDRLAREEEAEADLAGLHDPAVLALVLQERDLVAVERERLAIEGRHGREEAELRTQVGEHVVLGLLGDRQHGAPPLQVLDTAAVTP